MKKKILAVVAALAILMGALVPVNIAYAEPSKSEVCESIKNKDSAAYAQICGSDKTEADAKQTVKNILTTVFTWTGIISVIVIIIGGVFYITSQGEPDKIKRAKNAILYAIIGLIISLLSFAIVNFVLTAMQGS